MLRMLLSASVFFLLAMMAASCTGSETAIDDDSPFGWRSCGEIQCGSLTVPLDHDNPEAGTIDLAVTRAPAATDDKIGSVFMNFGGPSGESGEIMVQLAEYFVQVFGGRFDVVSWDPRGVGESERLQCEDFAEDNLSVGLIQAADGLDDEIAEQEDSLRRLADCASASGPIVDHLSTVDAVRDLDLLRAAVGDEQLTYVGFSYGSMIGWMYASQFPDNVRALVLDGAAPPTLWTVEGSLQQVAAFERTFNEFVSWCSDTPALCSASAEGLDERFDRLVDELIDDPIDLGDGRMFQAHDLVDSVFNTMYQPPEAIGPSLDSWLVMTGEGDPSGFIEYSAFANDTTTPGAFKAVLCADGYPLNSAEESRTYITDLLEVAPRFGLANGGIRCDLWPGQVKDLPEVDTTGAPTLLVIGNTLDPATPYESAVELDALLSDSVLLTFEGAGHTIVGSNDCIDAFVVDYLVNLRAPDAGERCR